MQAPHKRGKNHGRSENDVADHPGSKEIGLIFGEGPDYGCNNSWRARSEIPLLFVIRGADGEWQYNGAEEGDDRKDDKGERADTTDIAEWIRGRGNGGMRRVAEVCLSNPGSAVKQKWKPACNSVSVEKNPNSFISQSYRSKPKIEPSR